MPEQWTTGPEVLTVEQLAEHLQVSVQTVNRERREGRLTGFRVGRAYRYQLADVTDYITRMKENDQ